jgi:hypothetical protein
VLLKIGCSPFGSADTSPVDEIPDDAGLQDAPLDAPGVDAPADAASCSPDLTSDKVNCGACGHDCLGGDCHQGRCAPVLVAGGETFPAALAVDDTNLYWTSASGALEGLRSIPKAGGFPLSVAGFDGGRGVALATARGTVVFTADDDTLWEGSRSTAARLVASGLGGAAGVAADSSATYVAARTAGLVKKIVADGGSTTPLAGTQPDVTYVLVDAAGIYWAGYDSMTIGITRSGGGTAATAQFSIEKPSSFAQDDQAVYWGERYTFAIRKHSKTGGVSTTLKTVGGAPTIAVHGAELFWAAADGTIGRMKNDGSAPETLATNQGDLSAIAVDAQNIYVASMSGGTILRLAR